MAVVDIVPENAFFITGQLRLLYRAARRKVARTPKAADSDGVAKPNSMSPMTAKTIIPVGNTYLMKGPNLSDSVILRKGYDGAISGWSMHLPTI